MAQEIITIDRYRQAFQDLSDAVFLGQTPPNSPLMITAHPDYGVTDALVDLYNPNSWFTVNKQTERTNVFSLPLGIPNDALESMEMVLREPVVYVGFMVMFKNLTDNQLWEAFKDYSWVTAIVDEPVVEPAVVDPFVAEPFAEPAVVNPFVAEPVVEPAVVDPFVAEPFADPAVVDPAVAEPVADTAVDAVEPIAVDHTKLLQDIKAHTFVMCPRINGFDSYLLWQTLYIGSIPIVLRDVGNRDFEDMPICFVDDWAQVTEEFLKAEQTRIKRPSDNWEKLKMSYWVNRIS